MSVLHERRSGTQVGVEVVVERQMFGWLVAPDVLPNSVG